MVIMKNFNSTHLLLLLLLLLSVSVHADNEVQATPGKSLFINYKWTT